MRYLTGLKGSEMRRRRKKMDIAAALYCLGVVSGLIGVALVLASCSGSGSMFHSADAIVNHHREAVRRMHEREMKALDEIKKEIENASNARETVPQ